MIQAARDTIQTMHSVTVVLELNQSVRNMRPQLRAAGIDHRLGLVQSCQGLTQGGIVGERRLQEIVELGILIGAPPGILDRYGAGTESQVDLAVNGLDRGYFRRRDACRK